MTRRLRRKLFLGIAAAAVLAGATAAVVMAAQPSAPAHAHHGKRQRRGKLATAAAYLGLSEAQLRSELQAGKSLAEIANATPGKSEAGLIRTLEAADRQKLAAEAQRGRRPARRPRRPSAATRAASRQAGSRARRSRRLSRRQHGAAAPRSALRYDARAAGRDQRQVRSRPRGSARDGGQGAACCPRRERQAHTEEGQRNPAPADEPRQRRGQTHSTPRGQRRCLAEAPRARR